MSVRLKYRLKFLDNSRQYLKALTRLNYLLKTAKISLFNNSILQVISKDSIYIQISYFIGLVKKFKFYKLPELHNLILQFCRPFSKKL